MAKQAAYTVVLTSHHANGEGLPVSDSEVEVALLRQFPNVVVAVVRNPDPQKRGRGGPKAATRETR